MNKKRVIYTGLLILVAVIVSIASFSYAYLTRKDEQHGKINVVVGTLDYKIESDELSSNGEITIGPNETKKFEIKVTSLNSIDSNYELYYLTTSNDVEVGYSSSTVDNPVGQVTANNNKKIIVRVTNPTNSSQTVTFKAVGGFTGNTLTKEEGKAINQLTSLDTSCNVAVGTVYNFNYTGSAETFNVLCNGAYKVELWGAQGGNGNATYVGGKGGYTSGTIFLNKQNLYIYVGGQGTSNTNGLSGDSYANKLCDQSLGGYNGGGLSGNQNIYNGSGGGSTDIRLVSGSWDNIDSLKSRIMVAGAGGGGSYYNNSTNAGSGGAGGGLNGISGQGPTISNTSRIGGGGLQTTIGYNVGAVAPGFGYGGNGMYQNSTSLRVTGGGGAGYFGGSAGGDWGAAGGGGSSFISGHNGCVAISESSTSDNITPNISGCTDGTTNINCSVHYSNYAFNNTKMIDGEGYIWTTVKGSYVGQPQPDGTTAAGHSGNGYARITYLGPSLDYDYTGTEQVFISPITGEYKLETWGGQAGSYSGVGTGGYGGYSTGVTNIINGNQLYVNVGGAGAPASDYNTVILGGYNGGGPALACGGKYSCTSKDKEVKNPTSSGGGATHIAYYSGLLSTLSSHATDGQILIVSGGGGGIGPGGYDGANAGGYIGNRNSGDDSSTYGLGGSQTTAGLDRYNWHGAFGKASGGNLSLSELPNFTGTGGGAGYYGGARGFYNGASGSGGSGYIGGSLLTNKHMYCYNCQTSSEYSTKTITGTCTNATATADCSKQGNGYARITYIGD